MQKSKVISRRLVPADQHAPEAIHPPMGTFHPPPTCFEACLTFESLRLFAPAAHMGSKAKLAYGLPHCLVVIAFIHTHALRLLSGWLGAIHRNTIYRHPHQLHVIAIGPRDSESNGDAVRLCQHPTFYACLAAIRRVWSSFFPRPRALWSSRRPCSAIPSLSPFLRHTAPARPPRTVRTRLRPPILETADARWSPSTGPSYPRPSTGTPFATHRRCHWRSGDRAPGVCPHQSGACLRAQESRAPARPITHRTRQRQRSSGSSW